MLEMSFTVVFIVSPSVQSLPNAVRAKGQTRPTIALIAAARSSRHRHTAAGQRSLHISASTRHASPAQIQHCRLPAWAAISSAKIRIYFSNKTHGSNFIERHSETVMVRKYQNADCSLRQKKIIVSFTVIFGKLSLPIAATYPTVQPVACSATVPSEKT